MRSEHRLARSAAGLAIILIAGTGSARAETQLDRLEQIIEQQQRQLEQAQAIMQEQRHMQEDQAQKIRALEKQVQSLLHETPEAATVAAPAAAPAIAGGPVPPAEAQAILENPSTIPPKPEVDDREDRKGDYTLAFGAHLNRQVSVAADGNNTKAYQVDSTNVPSYVFIKAETDINEDVTLGAHVEYSVQENSAAAVNQNNETAGFRTDGRFFELTADSKTYGKGYFGKGWASSFFVFDVDKSGQAFGNFNATGQAFPGLLFYSKDLNDYTDIIVGEAFLDLQQAALINRIRYDTPVWKGLQLSGHYGENQLRGGRLLYNGNDLGNFDVTAAAAFQNKANGGAQYRADAGVGILHKPSGFNLTGVVANQEFSSDGRKSNGFVIRPGWRKRLFDFGETKTSVDYNRNWDVTQNGDTATSIGAFIVQDIDKYGMQLYAGYRYFDLDRDDIDLDKINVFSVGMNVFFDGQITFDSTTRLVR